MTADQVWNLTEEQHQSLTAEELKQVHAVYAKDARVWYEMEAQCALDKLTEEEKQESAKWN